MPARLRLALAVATALAAATVLAVALAGRSGAGYSLSAQGWAGALRPPGTPPRDFTLHEAGGGADSTRALRGQVVVLTFLYSTCQTTCPLTAQQIRGALDLLGHDVPALAVSVDPAADTAQHVRAFLVRQHVAGRLRYLIGSRAQLEPVWREYGIQAQRGSPASSDHSSYVVLLDRWGSQRVGFPVDQLTPEGLAHDIRRLQAERSPPHA